jgi:hypothetical protein
MDRTPKEGQVHSSLTPVLGPYTLNVEYPYR